MPNILLKFTVITLLLAQLGASTFLSIVTIIDFNSDNIELQNNIDIEFQELNELSENVDEKIQHLDKLSLLIFSFFNINIFDSSDFQSLDDLEITSPPPQL